MQDNLANALRDPAINMPKRFNIYRNNHWVSLIEAMKTAFPLCLRLTGEAFFVTASRHYLEHHPPKSRLMFKFGGEFPTFLDKYEGANSLPYLADMARLEQLITVSYHAKDAPYLQASDFQRVKNLEQLTFTFHPSIQMLASDYPVFSIYNDLNGKGFTGGHEGVIVRPNYQVFVYPLPEGSVEFFKKLQSGFTLGAAFIDNSDALTHLIQRGLVTVYSEA